MKRPEQVIRATIIVALLVWVGGCAAVMPEVTAPAEAEAATQTATSAATKVTTVEGITEYRLDNGLRVLLFPDRSKQQITVNITYLVGSRHEGYGETGMAHLLEHLVFKGTPNHPDITGELTERGAFPNGTTWFDRTNYFETFPATDDNLEWALDLESDRMINSFIAAEDLESEMTVVRNEWERGENSPGRVLSQRVMAAAYNWHNYGNATIGARADIENVPIDRLQAFYRKYYQPDNAILVVAGRFDPEHALGVIVDKFGSIPRPDRTGANQLFPTYTAEPAQDGERSVTLRRVGDVQLVMAAYHVAPGSHEDYPALQVMTHVLSTQPAGRLYKALVEPGLAASASAYAYQLKEPGLFGASAQVRQEDSLEAAAEEMFATLDEMTQAPPTAEEVDRAKTDFLSGIELAFNNPQGIALDLSEWASRGDWRLLFLHRDRLEKVTPEDVHRVAQAYLKDSNRTVGYFYPTEETPARAEIPAPPDVATLVDGYVGRAAIAEGEAFDPTPNNIEARTQRLTLPNGLQVALLPKENRGDAVNVSFQFRHGHEDALMGKGDRCGAGGRDADARHDEALPARDSRRAGQVEGPGRRGRWCHRGIGELFHGAGEPAGCAKADGGSPARAGVRREGIRAAPRTTVGGNRSTEIGTATARGTGPQPSPVGLSGGSSVLCRNLRGTDFAPGVGDAGAGARLLDILLWCARRGDRGRRGLRPGRGRSATA